MFFVDQSVFMVHLKKDTWTNWNVGFSEGPGGRILGPSGRGCDGADIYGWWNWGKQTCYQRKHLNGRGDDGDGLNCRWCVDCRRSLH
ncbi:hypothetical protein PHLCEN_2v1958 [Hermanssonia centrifuga]|uniref:Uncharacterized protein n=1 Tax=Hermanssonia centrifuga TaxID=98765 RepID=A0A2R6RVE8_9APHY|nr:hypothetical protein PHLCEN_2v1958 [Hermanssonia centrifuga]